MATPKKVQSIPLRGIVRNTPDQATEDGGLLEAINIRSKDGAWRGVNDKSKGRYAVTAFEQKGLFYHPVLPDNTYVTYKESDRTVNTILYTDGVESQVVTPVLTLPEGSVFDRFSCLGNTLIVWCASARFMLYWKDTAYIDLSSIPLPVVQVGDTERIDVTGIVSATYTLEDGLFPDYGFGDRNIYEFMRLQTLGNLFKEIENKKRDGYTRGMIQVRLAFKLFDGSYILHSIPIIHHAGFNSTISKLGVAVAGSDYSAVVNYMSVAKVGVYYHFTSEQADALKKFYDAGIIESVDIFTSRPVDTCDWNITIDKWAMTTDVGGATFTPPLPEKYTDLYATGQVYLGGSINISDLVKKALTGTYSGQYEGINGKLLLNYKDEISAEQLLPIDSFTHHTLLPYCDYQYNSRLHAGSIKTMLSKPLNLLFNESMYVKQLTGTTFNGWGSDLLVPSSYRADFFGAYDEYGTLSDTSFKLYAQAWINTEKGKRVVTSDIILQPDASHTGTSKGKITSDIVYTESIPYAGDTPTHTFDFAFNSEVTDTLNALDVVLSKFVAPYSGLYALSSEILAGTPVVGGVYLQMIVNGTVRSQYTVIAGTNTITDNVVLLAGDIVTFKIYAVDVIIGVEPDPMTYDLDMTIQANSFIQFELTAGIPVYSNGVNKAIALNSIISYPDYRATKLRYYYTYGTDRFFLKDFDLKASTEGNFAYAISDINADRFLPCNMLVLPTDLSAGTAMPVDDVLTDTDNYTDTNRMQVSEQSNPYIWPAQNSYRFGRADNSLIAIAGVQSAMSDSAFGQYPLYIFSKAGIYAIQTGSGEVLYASIQHLNNEVLVKRYSLVSITGAIVFACKEGVRIIEGVNIKELSIPVEGSITNPVSGNSHWLDAVSGYKLPQILQFMSNITFSTYIEDCIMLFDVENRELIISAVNKNVLYSYVYSFYSGVWSTRTEVFAGSMIVDGRMIGIKKHTITIGDPDPEEGTYEGEVVSGYSCQSGGEGYKRSLSVLIHKWITGGTVTVSKTVTGDPSNTEYFNITITGQGTDPIEQTGQVRVGEDLVFEDLKYDDYVITEAETEGYTLDSITPSEVVLDVNTLTADVEIVNSVATTEPLELVFDDIANVPVSDPTQVNEWNTLFDLPTKGVPFTSVEVISNGVYLYGGRNLILGDNVFGYNLQGINDIGGVIIHAGSNNMNSAPGDEKIYILNGVVACGDNCFIYFDFINGSLPKLESVGDHCFYYNHVPNIVLPSLKNAGNYFMNCNWDSGYPINLPNLETLGSYAFNGIIGAHITLQKLISIGNNILIDGDSSYINFPILEYLPPNSNIAIRGYSEIRIPRCISLGDNTSNNENIFAGNNPLSSILQVDASLMTCNGGNPDADIQYLIANSAVTIYDPLGNQLYPT